MSRTCLVSWIPALPPRDCRKARATPGWLLVVALLAFPNCVFHGREVSLRGPAPHTTAVFCDIEKVLGRHCASDNEKAVGIRLAAGAVALNTRQTSHIGLDDSPEALLRCGGEPEAVLFESQFPEGIPVCVNSGYASSPNAVCQERCTQFWGDVDSAGTLTPDDPPNPDIIVFCGSHAHASTNAPVSGGFDNACTTGGVLRPDFDSPAHPALIDPRRSPEKVHWVDALGVADNGSSLTRTAATSAPPGNPPFNSGAASSEWITHSDGFVEFSAYENNLSHVAGLSKVPEDCGHLCHDHDRSLADIDFGISLNKDGRVYILELGALVPGPDLNGSFGTYAANERFRVTVKGNSDGTATITYSRVTGSCMPGSACADSTFYTHAGSIPAQSTLRANASFREQGATLIDVRIVHIR